MIKRVAAPLAVSLAQQYPVLLITGPRQSGKTTLAQSIFASKPYANLESLNAREFAQNDPVGFLNQFPDGAVIDEVQRVPQLLSEIQVRVDAQPRSGTFILTGSHQAELRSATSQSLAGRAAILKLLPLSLEEISPASIDEHLYRGFYPRVVTQGLNPTQAYGAYVETYVEKDLRQITQIRDLSVFQKFMGLCAGRVGQLLNIDQLGADTGVSSTTVRHWLSALEASFLIYLLKPFHRNISKRLIKSPKLFFHDVGIATFLLGIENPSQLRSHPLRGALFENLVVSDVIKARWNRGLREQLHFYRDHAKNEVDLILEVGNQFLPIEIKSAETVPGRSPSGLGVFGAIEASRPLGDVLVYGGTEAQNRSDLTVLPYSELPLFYKKNTEFFP